MTEIARASLPKVRHALTARQKAARDRFEAGLDRRQEVANDVFEVLQARSEQTRASQLVQLVLEKYPKYSLSEVVEAVYEDLNGRVFSIGDGGVLVARPGKPESGGRL